MGLTMSNQDLINETRRLAYSAGYTAAHEKATNNPASVKVAAALADAAGAKPSTTMPGAHLFRLPQASLDGYVLKIEPNDPDGFQFVGREEMINLVEGDDFITIERGEMIELLDGRAPAHMFPGIPSITSAERMAVGQVVKIKSAARKIAGRDPKRYRREVRRLSREHIAAIERKIRQNDKARAGNLNERMRLHNKSAMADEVEAWIHRPLILERPDGSQLHKLQQAHAEDRWLIVHDAAETADSISIEDHASLFNDLQSFVVEHDWAKALAGSDVTGSGQGEIKSGAEVAAYEFLISDKRVIAVVIEKDDGHQTRMLITCGLEHGWALLRPYRMTDLFEPVPLDANTDNKMQLNAMVQPLAELLARNIRAICIMLEAEVAQTEVIRVDAKLNKAREKRGKLPLSDYHVVSLTRRERALPRARGELDPDREIRHPRMHFRRGHWRHYQDHRTWIKWMLVGDPDLGIIEKHYRL